MEKEKYAALTYKVFILWCLALLTIVKMFTTVQTIWCLEGGKGHRFLLSIEIALLRARLKKRSKIKCHTD